MYRFYGNFVSVCRGVCSVCIRGCVRGVCIKGVGCVKGISWFFEYLTYNVYFCLL